MLLIEFTPILIGLSIGIPIFFFGDWDYGLIVGALIWSVGGTIFLILLGLILRLVGVEYDLQKKEAAYRKILVIAEDDGTVRPKTIKKIVPPIDQISAPTIKPYSQSPKKKIGIPILKLNNIGMNSTSIITASIRLVPNDSIILENLIVSS